MLTERPPYVSVENVEADIPSGSAVLPHLISGQFVEHC